MLEACFADLLKELVFDDEVMDWIVDALHQSHADEKKFRSDAIARLQDEQSKLQNRLDKLYDDRLDGFIEPDSVKDVLALINTKRKGRWS